MKRAAKVGLALAAYASVLASIQVWTRHFADHANVQQEAIDAQGSSIVRVCGDIAGVDQRVDRIESMVTQILKQAGYVEINPGEWARLENRG